MWITCPPPIPSNKKRSKWKIPPQVTDIFLLENSATPPRAVALRPCEAPSIRFSPSFSICDIRIQKRLAECFAKSFPQKIVLPKLRPQCSATCPNTWRAEPQRKMSFPLSKEISPPPNQKKQGTFFFGVAERSEAVAERYERTIQFQATTRSARAISHRYEFLIK